MPPDTIWGGGQKTNQKPTPIVKVPSCTGGQSANVYTINLSAASQTELQAGIAKGLVAVAYDCEKLQILPGCLAGGSYSYISLTRREDNFWLTDTEIAANFPAAPITENSVFVRTSIVGQYAATIGYATREQFTGKCDGASHFIRVLRMGGGAARKDSSVSAYKEGDPCKVSSSRDLKPPKNCSSAVQVEIVPMENTSPNAERYCPSGTMWEISRCVTAPSSERCGVDNTQACEEFCEDGYAESCSSLAFYYYAGKALEEDVDEAASLWGRGCRLGNDLSCMNLATIYAYEDTTYAIDQLRTSCGWYPEACRKLGDLLSDEEIMGRSDETLARTYYQRACDGGDYDACTQLGGFYWDGKGGQKDEAKANQINERACKSREPVACRILSARYFSGGSTFSKDYYKAKTYAEKSCNLGEQSGCALLAIYYIDGLAGVSVDVNRGLRMLRESCEESFLGCLVLSEYYKNEDAKQSKEYAARACDLGDEDTCEKHGLTPKPETKTKPLPPPTQEEIAQEKANKLYTSGKNFYNIQEYQKARSLFKDAYLTFPTPDLLVNIGQCYRQLGKDEDALKAYRTYLAESPNSPLRPQIEGLIKEITDKKK